MDEDLHNGDTLLSQRNNKEFSATLCVVCVILAAYFTFFLFFGFTEIIGDSMENTVYNGQQCMVQRNAFNVTYGDIITIDTAADGEDEHIIIKRVIAMSGDRVLFMRTEDGYGVELYICKSGETMFKLAVEPYIKEHMIPDNINMEHKVFTKISVAPYDSDVLSLKVGELKSQTLNTSRVIPNGEYFVLGDNRNVSKDSRDYGTFKFSQITAKVLIII